MARARSSILSQPEQDPFEHLESQADTKSSRIENDCGYCGSHVSHEFARVFAYEDGRVYACNSCSPNMGIAEAARENREELGLDG